MGACFVMPGTGTPAMQPKYAPRLLSQSHLTYDDLDPPPPRPVSGISWGETTATYGAQDVASSTNNRRSRNLRKILRTEIHNQKLDTSSVTGGHVDSLHHQKKIKAVTEFFKKADVAAGDSPRRLAMISVAELDRAVADAGIGEVLFEQTLIIEGIPLTKRQRQRKHGATKGTYVQKERITAALASAYGVLVRHVKVLAVREGLAVKKTRWFEPPKKKKRRRSLRRKRPVRSEIDYEITTPDGPPCDDLEALLRGLARRSRDDEKVEAKPEDSGSSSSDGDSSSGSDDEDDDDSSDSESSSDGSEDGGGGGGRRATAVGEAASVTSEYTAELVDKLAMKLAKLVSADVGVLLEKLDEDISRMPGAAVPRKTRNIPRDGFLTRRAALVDAFGSYLQNRATVHRGERRTERKRSLMMKVAVSHATTRVDAPVQKRTKKKKTKKNSAAREEGEGGGSKYAV
jgi:hypothetical protein